MLFTSYGFILFLALTFLCYFLAPKKLQWIVLLTAGYVFYAFSGIENILFILATTASSYAASMLMAKNAEREAAYLSENKETLDKEGKKAYKGKEKKKRRRVLVACLVFNFGILAALKYTAFAVNNVNSLIGLFGGNELTVPSLLLPMGISFYTFGTMGYMIDVYRGKATPEKNPAKLALFVSFFPQLVQGPISRFGELAPQLTSYHRFDPKTFSFGIQRILWGFFKKLVIADRILVAMKTLLSDPERYSGGYVFLLIILYSAEIYADFTGGIDITIGIAEAMGIKLAENFKRPFSSRSTKEYWERWHITMGTWFRDYIFYPLSFSRSMMELTKKTQKRFGKTAGAKLPLYIATVTTWFLTGLWHGAGWNFIVWGLLNSAVILISKELEPLYAKFSQRFPKLTASGGYGVFMCIRTFLLMGVIRSLDCYRDVGLTFKLWGSMFTSKGWVEMLSGGILDLGLTISDLIVIGVAVIIVFVLTKLEGRDNNKRDLREKLYSRPALSWTLGCALFVATLLFGAYSIGYDATQFIYNQF